MTKNSALSPRDEYDNDTDDNNNNNNNISLALNSRTVARGDNPSVVDVGDDEDSTMLRISRDSQSLCPSLFCLSEVFQRLRNNWKVLVLGQILSFFLASAGAAQATLEFSCGLSVPTFTMSLVYVVVFSIHMPMLVSRRWHQWQCRILRRKHRRERLPTQEDDACDATNRYLPNGEHQGIGDDEDGVASATNNNNTSNNSSNSNTSNNHSSSNGNKLLLHASPLWYLLLAFVDVEANTITILGFKYTTLTSVTLFDALAIPSAMFLSRCIFFRSSRRYRTLHYVGVIVCMTGVVLNVLQDCEADSGGSDSNSAAIAGDTETIYEESAAIEEAVYPHKLRGDLCAILGGMMFGLNDVLTELTVSDQGDTTEYLGMVGFYGAIISMVQTYFLERDAIRDFFPGNAQGSTGGDDDFGEIEIDGAMEETCSASKALFLLVSFVVVINLAYAGRSRFLVISEATFFNLSLLTGDLWSVAFSVVAERIVPRPLFFAALTAVLSGVVFYEMAPSPAIEKQRGRALKSKTSDFGDDDDVVVVVDEGSSGNKYEKDGIVRNKFKDHNEPKTYLDSEIELNDVVIT
mmetsp:Transcript_7701/g.22538  ORF Transcript_7701/g.22538 Transcript_7701/m.22538 type:complete len:576 (-) Transcript_7701:165-1892(-)